MWIMFYRVFCCSECVASHFKRLEPERSQRLHKLAWLVEFQCLSLLLSCLERTILRAISHPKQHQRNEYCCCLVRLPTPCYSIVKNFSNLLRAIYFQRRSLGKNAPLKWEWNFHSREDPNWTWKGPSIFVVSFSFDNSMWVVDEQEFGWCFYSGHFATSDRKPDKSCHLVSLWR
jgi:hypothetical protein